MQVVTRRSFVPSIRRKQKLLSFLSDNFVEEIANVHLFPTGRFDFKIIRDILWTLNKKRKLETLRKQ